MLQMHPSNIGHFPSYPNMNQVKNGGFLNTPFEHEKIVSANKTYHIMLPLS
jgi:hypothetical protein